MRIKQLRISGFKSYKDATEIPPFDPGVNVIVGHNGSGKSNFFYAIRFLLSDEFSNMSSEERQALLHEGAGLAVLSGYVEIVFDNSDGRFPLDEQEVVIRRSFGGKKDEFFLDGKHTTKTDMNNLLETAGFSRANPYYMVQQGKITALTAMKNSERLELLKESAGTKVYEDKRAGSVKLLEETDGKRQKVDEVLGYIDERLKELEEEELELRQFMTLDRKRRAVEYAIHDKELQYTRSKVDQYEAQRQGLLSKFEELHTQQSKFQDKLKELEGDLATKETELQCLERDRRHNEEERQDALRRRAEFELNVRDLNEKFSRNKTRDVELKKELDSITGEIANLNKQLEAITGEFNKAATDELSVRERLGSVDVRLKSLNAKQGRQKMFSSQQDRDKFLNNELTAAREELSAKQSKLQHLEDQIKTISDDVKKADDIMTEMDTKKRESDEACRKVTNAKKERDTLSNSRRELWHKEQELEQQRTVYREKLAAAERALHGKMPKMINTGLNAIRTWSEKGLIKGTVYGPVLELFQSDPRFYTAIEVTAGNSLFHVVVDTDDTATEILKLMASDPKTAGGSRITFMPLNRLQPKEMRFPDSQDAVPLVSKLEYAPEFSKAFTQVFGRTLVCRNLDVAGQMSKQYDLDCITLDGDQVSRKGAMTGGYHDQRTNRLNLMQAFRETMNRLRTVTQELTAVKAQIAQYDQRISVTSGEQHKLDQVHMKARDDQEQMRLDLDAFSKEKVTLKTLMDNRVKEIRVAVTETQQQIKSMEEEMANPMQSKLSTSETNLLHKLTAEVTSIREELMTATDKRASGIIESRLKGHLEKRRNEITQELSGSDINELNETTRQNSYAFDAVSKEVEDITKKSKDMAANAELLETDIKALRTELDKIKNDDNEMAKLIQESQKDVSKLQIDRALGLQKIEEHTKSIRELGTIPQEEYETLKGIHLDKLHAELRKANQALEKYSHVNKKAAIQYETFKEQRSELEAKKKELHDSSESIKQLIDTLDQKKDEAINRSFQVVSARFSEVWKELCPNGEGHLLMITNEDEGRARQFTGVSMQVQFSSATQMQPLQLLSGGQKTLAALALIFAIQRSDPAPFYLFDEIDANLDPEHRMAVASLINKQAHSEAGSQFIVSTFWPQLVSVADKAYRISFTHPVSNISAVNTNAALQFVRTTGVLPRRDRESQEGQDWE